MWDLLIVQGLVTLIAGIIRIMKRSPIWVVWPAAMRGVRTCDEDCHEFRKLMAGSALESVEPRFAACAQLRVVLSDKGFYVRSTTFCMTCRPSFTQTHARI